MQGLGNEVVVISLLRTRHTHTHTLRECERERERECLERERESVKEREDGILRSVLISCLIQHEEREEIHLCMYRFTYVYIYASTYLSMYLSILYLIYIKCWLLVSNNDEILI